MINTKINMIKSIVNHYKSIWLGNMEVRKWKEGPIYELPEDFCILTFAPTSTRKMWTYATCGMSSINTRIELHLFSKKRITPTLSY